MKTVRFSQNFYKITRSTSLEERMGKLFPTWILIVPNFFKIIHVQLSPKRLIFFASEGLRNDQTSKQNLIFDYKILTGLIPLDYSIRFNIINDSP
jgi:hypothetical protein